MCFALFVFSMSLVCASFEVGNLSYFIEDQYGPSTNIRGWVNMSFGNEPTDSLFEDSFGNSISLIDLLKNNTGLNYSCLTKDCGPEYSASNEALTKSFSLNSGESEVIGLELYGKVIGINSISLNVESTASESCYNQLEINFFEGKASIGNNKTSAQECAGLKSYGCFNSSKSGMREYVIRKEPYKYCQKIALPHSPGFNLGAEINQHGDTRNLTMALYDDNEELVTCNLPEGEGELSCEVEYLIKEPKEYYVCVYSSKEGNSTIKGYSDSEGCGSYGVYIGSGTASYKIFAEGKKFDNFETLKISNPLGAGNLISTEAHNYISKKYLNFDCLTGCILPIKFTAKTNQNIVVNSLSLDYETASGNIVDNYLYDLTSESNIVNSGFLKINLDNAGFEVPSSYKNHTFKLEFDGSEILSKKISVEAVPTIDYLFPRQTASAVPTRFRVYLESGLNVTNYKWEFGDNKIETTAKNEVIHIYNSTGRYNLKITITDNFQRSSYKVFNITVGSPKEMINSTITQMQSDLVNINKQLQNFSKFDKEGLDSVLDLDENEEVLKQLQMDYVKAMGNEEEYNRIMTELLNIEIPKLIIKTKLADKISFYPRESLINLDVLKSVGGGTYEGRDRYVNAVLAWHNENIESKITFDEYTAIYDDYNLPVLNVFEIDLKEKESLSRDPYLFLLKLDDIRFDKSYSEKEASGYYYIELKNPENAIIFSTTKDLEFSDLPLFISPNLDLLPLAEDYNEEERNNLFWLITGIVILLFVALIVYIVMQEWYKRKYEGHLFKSRNQLYNIVIYIQGERDKGIDDEEISKKLRKSGWNSEQITYALKKHAGKRTGMIEIPITKLFDLFEKKQPSPNANFDKKYNKINKPLL